MWANRKANAGLGSRIGGAVKGAAKGAVTGGATGSVVGGLAGGGVATPVTGAVGGAVGSTLGAAKGAVKGFFKKPTQKTQSPAVPQRQAASEACPRIGNSEELWKKHNQIKEATMNRPAIAGIIRPTRAGFLKKMAKGAAIGGGLGAGAGAAVGAGIHKAGTVLHKGLGGSGKVPGAVSLPAKSALNVGIVGAGLGAGVAGAHELWKRHKEKKAAKAAAAKAEQDKQLGHLAESHNAGAAIGKNLGQAFGGFGGGQKGAAIGGALGAGAQLLKDRKKTASVDTTAEDKKKKKKNPIWEATKRGAAIGQFAGNIGGLAHGIGKHGAGQANKVLKHQLIGWGAGALAGGAIGAGSAAIARAKRKRDLAKKRAERSHQSGIVAGLIPVNAKINWKKAAKIGAGVGLAGLGAGLAINKAKTGSFLPFNKNTSATPKPSTTGTYIMNPAEHKQVMKEVDRMAPGGTYTMSPSEHKKVMKQVDKMGQASKASAPGLVKDRSGVYHGPMKPRLNLSPKSKIGPSLWKSAKLDAKRISAHAQGKGYYVRHNPDHNTYELRKIASDPTQKDPLVKIFHDKSEALKARNRKNMLVPAGIGAALGAGAGLAATVGAQAYHDRKMKK